MNKSLRLSTLSLILSGFFASTAIQAQENIFLEKQLPDSEFSNSINSLQFNIYATRDAAKPIAIQTFYPGEWQITATDAATVVRVEFSETIYLPAQNELWLEVQSNGAVLGEREMIQAAAGTTGVTLALGNSLNMSANRVINLGEPLDSTDAATKQYVLDTVATVAGDNLGDHTATGNIKLDGNWLSGDGGAEGVYIGSNGNVGVGNALPAHNLDVAGSINASAAIKVNGVDVLTSENDPKVGVLTADKWCNSDGIVVNCNAELPGITETDPTVPAAIKDGIDWTELSGIPAGFSDGMDNEGITTESDPTVLASVKDGVSWSELSAIPTGFSDDTDDEGVTSVSSGAGLTGGPITSVGTLSIQVPLSLSGYNSVGGVIKAVNSSAAPNAVGVEGISGHTGVLGEGDAFGGIFRDSNSSGYSYVGNADYGIRSFGDIAGGYFKDLDNLAYAYLGYGSTGVRADGDIRGGDFTTGSTTGRAVSGIASNTGNGVVNYGGWFEASGEEGRAVGAISHGDIGYAFKGIASATGDVTNYGGHFLSYGNTGIGVYGEATATGAVGNVGGYFKARGDFGVAVYGTAPNIGVQGDGDKGVQGGGRIGVYGTGYTSDNTGAYGITGYARSASDASGNVYAVYGSTGNLGSGSKYAGYFNGNVTVTGSLSKAAGSFKIDHPLDPENKTLSHSFVESPDMMNIYNGNVVLDSSGEGVVEMPDWFEALNQDFRYQLTTIGGYAPVYIAEKLTGNSFRIAGGNAGLEVSWQVTGIRHDPYAEQHRIPLEEDKPEAERGYYLSPLAYGLPEKRSVEWVRNPDVMIEKKRLPDLQKDLN